MAEISRRSFLKGALAAAGAAAVSTVLPVTASAEEQAAAESKWSWEQYPGDLTAAREEDTGVLVVGCGFAGSVAAVTPRHPERSQNSAKTTSRAASPAASSIAAWVPRST